MPVSVNIAGFLACAFFLIFGANGAFKLLDRFKEQPPPASTYQIKGNYALREELYELKREIQVHLEKQDSALVRMNHDIHTAREDILEAGEHRATKLHERINEVMKEVARLIGRLG